MPQGDEGPHGAWCALAVTYGRLENAQVIDCDRCRERDVHDDVADAEPGIGNVATVFGFDRQLRARHPGGACRLLDQMRVLRLPPGLLLWLSPLLSSLLPAALLSLLLRRGPNSAEVFLVTDDLFDGAEISTASRQIRATVTSVAAQGSIGGRVVSADPTEIGSEAIGSVRCRVVGAKYLRMT